MNQTAAAEITPEMIEAGVNELLLSFDTDGALDAPSLVVEGVFRAMLQARDEPDPFPNWTYGQTLSALDRLFAYSGTDHAPRLLAGIRRLIAAEVPRVPLQWLQEP